jgi:DMSO/TMAO reductase YedYZ heme-binding membrane subunit
VWWYTARASGLVAWLLGIASVLWGLALSTRALGRRPRAPWLLDLHRFLGGLTVLFVGLHIGALVADNYVHFGLADVLVPFASSWRTVPVAIGVVAFWLLLAVESTSLLMRHIPKHWWRGIHLSSYGVALGSTLHALTAGTDRSNRLMWWSALASAALIVFFSAYRLLAPRRRTPRNLPARPRLPAT